MKALKTKIDIVPPDRYEDVILHLRHNFFPDEPLNYSVQLSQPGEPNEMLESHSLHTLRDGTSYMAFEENTGEIAGVALNGVLYPGDTERALKELEDVDDTKFETIFKFIYAQNMNLDLFTKYNTDKIFECRILSVDAKYRGLGLGKKLLEKTIQLAKSQGFKIIKGDATGIISQRLTESLGFNTETQVLYSDYKNEFGEQIFKTPPPHDRFKIQVKQLGP